jgi:RNA polymerase sigma factor (sigma-70 family)
VKNRIYDEVRKVSARPGVAELPDEIADDAPSPLEQAIGREGFERYQHALRSLNELDREAIISRIELQYSYEEVAAALGKSNANAARMAVTRAIVRLVAAMQQPR